MNFLCFFYYILPHLTQNFKTCNVAPDMVFPIAEVIRLELIIRTDPARLAVYAQSKGLNLSAADAAALINAHTSALRNTRRLEIEEGFMEDLIGAFADSLWLSDAEQLCGLIELFYYMKNRTRDLIPDERMLAVMRKTFDDPCRGSLELLADHLEEYASWI